MVGLCARPISDDASHFEIFKALKGLIPDRPPVSHIGNRFRSRSDTASILQTCQEARAEGLRYYTLAFGYEVKLELGDSNITLSVPPRIYINWEIDTICLMPPDKSEDIDNNGFGQLPLEEVFSLFQSADTPRSMKIAIGPCKPEEIIEFNNNLQKYGLGHSTLHNTDITPHILGKYGLNDPVTAEYRQLLRMIHGLPFAIYFVPIERVIDIDTNSNIRSQLDWMRETMARSVSYRPEKKELVMDQIMMELTGMESSNTLEG
jgi:hypothetical protein